MNYQIQRLSIHAAVHGTAEPALVFLHYWGGTSRTWRKVTAELEGLSKTVAYDARVAGESPTKPQLATKWQTLPTKLSHLSKRWESNNTSWSGIPWEAKSRAARRPLARGCLPPSRSGSEDRLP
jgi:pimeloyl-ACP methyl ester carboxylesterase